MDPEPKFDPSVEDRLALKIGKVVGRFISYRGITFSSATRKCNGNFAQENLPTPSIENFSGILYPPKSREFCSVEAN
jgi:hypothetical protein